MKSLRMLVCRVFGHRLVIPVGERERRDSWNHLLGWEATCPRCGRIVFEPIDRDLMMAVRGGVDKAFRAVFGRRP
jgi:hypothetical protein